MHITNQANSSIFVLLSPIVAEEYNICAEYKLTLIDLWRLQMLTYASIFSDGIGDDS